MSCPLSISESAAALLHHLGAFKRPCRAAAETANSIRWFLVKFKPPMTLGWAYSMQQRWHLYFSKKLAVPMDKSPDSRRRKKKGNALETGCCG
jgi:hypothetical protein